MVKFPFKSYLGCFDKQNRMVIMKVCMFCLFAGWGSHSSTRIVLKSLVLLQRREKTR